MPVAQTRDFGELSYEPQAELTFPFGIPGFNDQRRFLLIEHSGLAPVILLQSLETPGLCFLAIPVSVVDPAYQSGIAPEDLRALGIDEAPATDGAREPQTERASKERTEQTNKDLLYLAILSPSDKGGFTANLLAPIVIHLRTRVGIQAVRRDRRYSHRHPLPAGLLEHVCS